MRNQIKKINPHTKDEATFTFKKKKRPFGVGTKYIKNPLVKYRKIFLLIFIIAMIAGVGFLLKDTFGVFGDLPEITKITKKLTQEDVPAKIITPKPLRIKEEIAQPDSYLTLVGVHSLTNDARRENGLPSLSLNTKLNASAKLKLQDMFKRQYFDHDAPTGEGVSDLAEKVVYKYVIIGENLALGNFKNDLALVDGWMNSPGHRENILNKQYTQIGIAVGQGMFEGKNTWLAVQHFGKPLSDCPAPDETIKKQIEEYQKSLDILAVQLESLEDELKKGKRKLTREEYNRKVDQYNAILLEYNSLLDALNALADKYNNQVKAFNNCLKE